MSRKVPHETVMAALTALSTGRPLRDVAREFGVTQTTVARWRDNAIAAVEAAPHGDEAPPIVVPPALAAIPAALPAASAPVLPDLPPIPAALPAASAPVLPDLPPIPEGADTLERARALLARVEIIAEASLRVGNVKAAQSAMRDALKAINDIARYEKSARADGDGIHVTQEEIDEARDTVRARLAALADRPLLCAECGRALAIHWGERASKESET